VAREMENLPTVMSLLGDLGADASLGRARGSR
jgi:hypothetical protein